MINFDPQVEIFQGDILAVRGRGWLSDGIAKAEYGDHEPSFGVTHVGLFIAPGNDISTAIVIEALNRVTTNVLRESIDRVRRAYVLHDVSLTDLERSSMLEIACSFSTNDYGYVDIGAQYLNATFGTHWYTDNKFMAWYLDHKQICSYVVDKIYESLRRDFACTGTSCKPSDIMAFALEHPQLYRITQIK